MHDLAFVAFLVTLFGLGFRRPFLLVLVYVYIDIVSPQRLTYYLLNAVPVSLISVVLAVGAWAFLDDKKDLRIAPRQVLIFILLIYCGITTTTADFPIDAMVKWDWVWKTLAFAIFLPLTLRTKLRIEALLLFMVVSAASIIIVGGIKTLFSGGGYGELNLMVDNNTGLYESSIISCVAIAIIPLIIWLGRYGTIFPRDWRVRLFCLALIFACLLIPVGTQARTGLICIAVLGVTFLRQTRRPFLYVGMVAIAAAVAVPNLPASYTERMSTIKSYKEDQSAGTRLAVWKSTLDYVDKHPFGGGFDAYRSNNLRIVIAKTTGDGESAKTQTMIETDQGRAYHSSYFEMLGEQGWPGLALWLMIHLTGLFRMEVLFARYRKSEESGWIGSLAIGLQQAHLIYLVGSVFCGIAFQPFVYMLVGLQIGLDGYAKRAARPVPKRSGWNAKAAAAV